MSLRHLGALLSVVALTFLACRVDAQERAIMAPQPGRIALVVGVAGYDGAAALKAPREDAVLVAATLKKVGFAEPTLVPDPSAVELNRSIDQFLSHAQSLAEAGREVTAVIYFAGHGVVVDRETYLLPRDFPIDATAMTPVDARKRAINAQDLVDRLARTGVSRVLVILDACRNNPWERGAPSLSVEFKATAKLNQSGSVWFATSMGGVAQDRMPNSNNSPFAFSIAQALPDPAHAGLHDAASAVSDLVFEITQHLQRPTANGVMQFKITATDEEWLGITRRASSAAALHLASLNALDQSAGDQAEDNGARGAAPASRPFVEPYRGRPCPDPPRNASPIAVLDRYLAAYGQEQLRSKAKEGSACEQWLLGVQFTLPGQTNRESAASWSELAAAQGFDRAITVLSYIYSSAMGPAEQEKLGNTYRRALARNVPGAIANLGTEYRLGSEAYPQSGELAERYLRQAVGLGSARAANQLAYMFATGELVEKNISEAAKLYQQAIDLGDLGSAPDFAGLLFAPTDATPPDPKRGLLVLENAAGAGGVAALYELGRRYEYGLGVTKNSTLAIQYYERAAREGDPAAMEGAARVHAAGQGVPRDTKAASYWYGQAAALGNVDAEAALGKLYVEIGDPDSLTAAFATLDNLLKRADRKGNEAIYPMSFVDAAWSIQKLAVAPGGPPVDPVFVVALARNYGKPGNLKQFTVPIRCGAHIEKFLLYVFDWGREAPPTRDQLDWLRTRNCEAPQDVRSSFEKLYAIAIENHVSFSDLCVYALNGSKEALPESSSVFTEGPYGPVTLEQYAFKDGFGIVLVGRKNAKGESTYAFVRLTRASLDKLEAQLDEGKDVRLAAYGKVLVSGIGTPDSDTRRQVLEGTTAAPAKYSRPGPE